MSYVHRAAALALLMFALPMQAAPDAPLSTTPYAGVLRLEVDATDLDHRIFHVREQIPVSAGVPRNCAQRSAGADAGACVCETAAVRASAATRAVFLALTCFRRRPRSRSRTARCG